MMTSTATNSDGELVEPVVYPPIPPRSQEPDHWTEEADGLWNEMAEAAMKWDTG